MSQLYQTMYRSDKKSEEEKKFGLIAAEDSVCYNCNKKGHKSFQCPLKKGKGRSSGGRKEKNADKVPSWWRRIKGRNINSNDNGGKANKETGMYCQEVEFILTALAIEFPATLKLLKDPNVWITDTGASCDSTGHYLSMINNCVPAANNGVTLPDRNIKAMGIIGDIRGTICAKNDSKLHPCTIHNVRYCKENRYNLFSITKHQKSGWMLHGDGNSIWITKGSSKVAFDIKIQMKEGMIFAAYIERIQGNEVANIGTDSRPFMYNVNKVHGLLGHPDKGRTRSAVKNLGWVITRGQMGT
eukprot:6209566-Ditylum_brightwellii.AAC.1